MRQFFDTNVLVYAHDPRHAAKRELARSLADEAMSAGAFVVSTQVLAEFYSTVARRQLLAAADALKLVRLWGEHDVVAHTPELIVRGIALHQSHSLSIWDALIVQAALDAQCDLLLTEDMQHGRRFGELEIRNPFAAAGVHEASKAYGAHRSAKRRTTRRRP